MLFFSWFSKRSRPHYEYGGNVEKAVRGVLFAFLVFTLIWAFWGNSSGYVQRFKAEARLSDTAAMLESKQKHTLVKLIAEAEAKYGVHIHVKVSPLPITSADAAPESIFVGVCPAMKQTVILMPAGWRSLLGDGFILRLKEELMPEFFKRGQWVEGLTTVLAMLDGRLGEIVNGAIEHPQPDDKS